MGMVSESSTPWWAMYWKLWRPKLSAPLVRCTLRAAAPGPCGPFDGLGAAQVVLAGDGDAVAGPMELPVTVAGAQVVVGDGGFPGVDAGVLPLARHAFQQFPGGVEAQVLLVGVAGIADRGGAPDLKVVEEIRDTVGAVHPGLREMGHLRSG